MWWAMALGALAGYLISELTPYRHGFWVALGVAAGYGLYRVTRFKARFSIRRAPGGNDERDDKTAWE